MSNQTDILDNVLGVTDVVETTTRDVTPPKPVIVPETKLNEEDIDNDYKYQRENFYNLIERGQDAIGASHLQLVSFSVHESNGFGS